ncbi:protein SIEVE ELEMENT OCCLUSION B-like [Rhodamnia argentea]|uniref:Protein SIEVE ELEMENT OCCLUSION B-like n=1 Tax=Rhodamnia argentea TaxID=178133 RepID=A0A8B8P9C5_9MYRT|nr:protein SIEVE ELEMENT OCCLUSION B-like [Rhodamnia argentea]
MAGVAAGVVAAPPRPPKVQQKGGHRMFAVSDDSAMMKQIQATHSPDSREVNVKPILSLIESIFRHATPSIDGVLNGKHVSKTSLEEKAYLAAFDGVLEALPYVIQKISCEISCKCSGGGDAHGTTMAIFNMISAYSWDAKLVLALAAFGVNYGEFSLIVQLYPSNHLAKSVALLKQLPDMLEHSSSLKPQFDALNNLIFAMVDVAKCIIQFSELPPQYISSEVPPLSTAMTHIPTAVYWTIRSIVSCASQIASLIGLGNEYIPSATEAWELSSLAYKVGSIHEHLKKQLAICYQHIDEKRHFEAYQTLVRLFDKIHLDNMTILKHLIYLRDDIQPLVDGTTKSKVSLEVLRKKTVLLLISDLEIAIEDIELLNHMYRESRSRAEYQFEIVWLPIVDIDPKSAAWDMTHQQKFEELQSIMPWHTVHHPSILDPAVIKYIREVWRFSKRFIIVALDPQGKLASPNALHMIRIWGSVAYPFTKEREEALWKDESWRLELIIDGLDDGTIMEWTTQGSYICLFGGENLDWIRKFTSAAKAVAKLANIPLGMVYVGKSNSKERVRRTVAAITSEKLSYCWNNPTFFWFFWARLESMLHSKLHHGKSTENDPVMHEIMTILSYDGSDEGWAIFCHGTLPPVARARGQNALASMEEFDRWKDDANQRGFAAALDNHLKQKELESPHHCNRLILPGIDGGIPERVVCAECGRVMEKFIMYRCCTE